MKKWYLVFLLVFTLLVGCAVPTTDASQPVAPTTQAPAPVLPTETSAPTEEPTPTTAPTEEPTPTSAPVDLWIAYIGQDGNLRLLNHTTGEERQITNDALAMSSESTATAVMYSNPQWSTDGMYLAYKRDIGTPKDDGYQLVYEVWVYNTATQTSQMLVENLRIIGMAWKPGTHLLAYSFAVEEGYFVFTARGQIDSSLAKGIWATDMDSGENMELITPQNGYSLASPQWSRDGRFMAFEEVAHYEGRGNFAIYDFETAEFMAWGEPVGFIDFSPDSQTLAFDTLTYASNGTERIFLRPTLAGEAVQFSPDYELGYAFYPRFSPDGEQIAYLAGLGEPDSSIYTLFVQPTAGGEATSLGEFDFGLYVSWLPDGSGFILAAGQFEARQVLEVSLADGSVKVLAEGDSPSMPQLAP